MEQVTANVFTETKVRGCNPSYVTTSDGVVVIDTPQLPTRALAMREAAEHRGPIRYVINTEHHVDHIFGNYYFKGAGTVVHHQGVFDRFMVPGPELDPFAYAAEAIPTDDPEGAAIFPERYVYYADPNKGQIVFTILGEDELAAELANLLSVKTINGKPVFVRFARRAQDARGSQILYVAASETQHIEAVLMEVAGTPVLTVADTPAFAAHGGMVGFAEDAGKVRFEINLGHAERSGLRISAKLLALARVVDGN